MTEKSLSDRIAEWVKAKKPAKRDQNRADFITNEADVRAALEKGWSARACWEVLHNEGKITCTYQAFMNYVNKLIVARPSQVRPAQPQVSTPVRQERPKSPIPPLPSAPVQPAVDSAPGSFRFNQVPNKDELL